MGSLAGHHEELTDEEVFTAGIVQEGVVLAAEEGLERILGWERQEETQTGGPQSWLSVDMAGTSAQLGTSSSEDPPHLTLIQAAKGLPEQVLKGRAGWGGGIHEEPTPTCCCCSHIYRHTRLMTYHPL